MFLIAISRKLQYNITYTPSYVYVGDLREQCVSRDVVILYTITYKIRC